MKLSSDSSRLAFSPKTSLAYLSLSCRRRYVRRAWDFASDVFEDVCADFVVRHIVVDLPPNHSVDSRFANRLVTRGFHRYLEIWETVPRAPTRLTSTGLRRRFRTRYDTYPREPRTLSLRTHSQRPTPQILAPLVLRAASGPVCAASGCRLRGAKPREREREA